MCLHLGYGSFLARLRDIVDELAQFCEEESYPEDIQELLEAVDAFYDKTLELQHQFDETLTGGGQDQDSAQWKTICG
ncbi:hypothetical protein T4E_6376 [Trichinella pseudospiralis]|uniref:Uncharacterized protein n=1 Tax=Trichinella pseudospiralis TaxID=6337 RepID=A0A0V0XPN7_TRIPS|nr:hypothetical protein T4E_6376 [Trichinella pseudospiralis]